MAPSGSAAAATQGRHLLAGEGEEDEAAAAAEQKVKGSGWFRMGWRRRRRKGKRGAVNQAPSKKRTRCWYGCRDKRKWYQGRGPEIQTASVKAEPHTVAQHCGKAVMKRSESEGKGPHSGSGC